MAKYRSTFLFLMHQITTMAMAEATHEFLELGFTVQNARVMIVLLQNPDIRLGRLSEITCIEPPTLSLMLTRLASRGMIVRRKDARDNRAVTIRLTARGKRLALDCHRSSLERERWLLDAVPPRDVAVLNRSLMRVFENTLALAPRAGALKAKTRSGSRRRPAGARSSPQSAPRSGPLS